MKYGVITFEIWELASLNADIHDSEKIISLMLRKYSFLLVSISIEVISVYPFGFIR